MQLHTIKGIVLKATRYTDNSLIANVYTNLFGLQSYIVRGINSKTSKTKINYFQGLSVLEMVVTKSDKQKLETIKEITGIKTHTLEFDFTKNAIALFLNELVYKTIKEEEANIQLFVFLESAFELLHQMQESCLNFHLVFMLKYAQYLGFYPTENYSDTTNYFDLTEGFFVSERPAHQYYLDPEHALILNQLMNSTFENSNTIQITNIQRRQMIACLLQYYKLHQALVSDLTSHTILEQL